MCLKCRNFCLLATLYDASGILLPIDAARDCVSHEASERHLLKQKHNLLLGELPHFASQLLFSWGDHKNMIIWVSKKQQSYSVPLASEIQACVGEFVYKLFIWCSNFCVSQPLVLSVLSSLLCLLFFPSYTCRQTYTHAILLTPAPMVYIKDEAVDS